MLANDFRFKRFTIEQKLSNHKVGTDSVLLGAWVSIHSAINILDIGTGTGVIALMLAQRSEEIKSHIDAIEIQEADWQQASRNITMSPWADRVTALHSSLQRFDAHRQYDLIVSNPPYFQKSLKPPEPKRAMVRHTDTLPFTELIGYSKRLLSHEGRLAVILPENESRQFIPLCTISALYLRRRCDVITRGEQTIERVLLEFSRTPGPIANEMLKMREGDDWSEEYRLLTKEFYLNF